MASGRLQCLSTSFITATRVLANVSGNCTRPNGFPMFSGPKRGELPSPQFSFRGASVSLALPPPPYMDETNSFLAHFPFYIEKKRNVQKRSK